MAPRKIREIRGLEVQKLLRQLHNLTLTSKVNLSRLALEDKSSPLEYNTANDNRPKHIVQQSSLIQHMGECGMFSPSPSVYVEFGSGIGRFSEQIQEHTKGSVSHLLIDRQVFKSSKLREQGMSQRFVSSTSEIENSAPTFKPFAVRETVDIAHLDLRDKLDSLVCSPCSESQPLPIPLIYAVSKHLCGDAFDLMLSCVQTYSSTSQSQTSRVPMCVVPCCHYLTTWETYSNKLWFTELGFTREEFEVCVAVSHWATMDVEESSSLKSSTTTTTSDFVIIRDELEFLEMDGNAFEQNLTRQQKIQLGRACKLLIDRGREDEVRCWGNAIDNDKSRIREGLRPYSNVRIARYTSESVEGTCLLAYDDV